MPFSYSIALEPAEEGGYTVRVPRLPGCVTEGDTVEEAVANARDAITQYLLSLRDDDQDLPPADAGSFFLAVEVGVDSTA